jgi:AraC-like DNA-binding protein
MEKFFLSLDDIPRENPFWLPVKYIGYIPENYVYKNKVYHPTVNFSFALSGPAEKAVNIIGGVKHVNKIPCFGISAPGALYEALTPMPMETLYLSYDAKYIDEFKRYDFDLHSGGYPIEISNEISSLVGELFRFCSKIHSPGSMDRVDRICERLISEAFLFRVLENKALDEKERVIRDIASFLEIHYAEMCDWEELSRKFGFSRRTFFREWNKFFDLSPAQYVSRLKINEAKRLLMETAMTVNEISKMLNFEDQLYFSRKFRKSVGISPRQFRELKKTQ